MNDDVILSRFDVGMTWRRVVLPSHGLLCVRSSMWSLCVVGMHMLFSLVAVFTFYHFNAILGPIRIAGGMISLFSLFLSIRNYWNISTPVIFNKNKNCYCVGKRFVYSKKKCNQELGKVIGDIIGIQIVEKNFIPRVGMEEK